MNSSNSLQIPSGDSPPGPSRHHHNQSSSSAANSAANAARPVSVSAHHPTPVTPQNNSSRRHQRASHTVVSSSSQQQPQSQNGALREENSLYADVYSHPAAMAYAAAHPRRTIPKFGPYLLLQTLGEGEFGKVKLGLHCQWGEEVAVKLIRRGNVDSTVRMSKVEREIEVLRVRSSRHHFFLFFS
jgi:protein-serine/threonine kinase